MSVNACVAFLIRAALVRGTTTNPGVALSSPQPAMCGFWEWQMPMCPVLQGMQTAPSHSVPYLVVHTSALQNPCVKLLWVSGCVRITDPLMAPDPNLYLGPGIYLSLYPTNFIPLDKPLNPLNTPFQPHTEIPSVLSVSCSHAPYIPFQQGPSLSQGPQQPLGTVIRDIRASLPPGILQPEPGFQKSDQINHLPEPTSAIAIDRTLTLAPTGL